MVINSVVFLFCFLPLSLLLYYLVPGRAKNAVLLAESLIFYCWTGIENQAFCQPHCIFGAAGHQIIQQQGKRQKAEQEHHTVKNHGVLPSFESC